MYDTKNKQNSSLEERSSENIEDEISTFASESYSGQGLTLNEILRLILGKSYNLILAMGYELYRD